ncbi:MAG: molybdopterin-dependent oxidoreductase [Candidatus Aureabacteria bacterium]|nr:molybdopterin-dependent oxidoreductase [Candidatus Auribacterota bacterium]
MSSHATFREVNQVRRKVDGIGLVTGTALYTDDYDVHEMLSAKVLRSPHPHARIKAIDASRARALKGVHAVLTWRDVPRIIITEAGQGYPEPSPYDKFILDNKVRFVGDEVAVVAAETTAIALQALALIKVTYEELPAVFDPRDSMKKGAPVLHDEPEWKIPIPVEMDPKKNLCGRADVTIGDMPKGFAAADLVLEREYENQYAQHVANEPHTTISYLDPNNRLIIVTSTQVPFHVRRIVARALDLPIKRIRVIKPRIGGGFGSKQDIVTEPLAAALTMATGRPVRLQLTREETFTSSRTRHQTIIRLKTGIKKDGTLTAIEMDALQNAGPYGTHGLTVLTNTGSKILPLFRCENVRFNAWSVYTNLSQGGAYRGYGGTQSGFAMNIQMDEMARAIGMDLPALYKKLHIRKGEGSPVFAALGEGAEGHPMTIGSCGLSACIDIVAREIGWAGKRNNPGTGRLRRGIGMAVLMQGSSIPKIDMASCSIKMNDDGSFNLLCGATDIGTGSDTVMAKIAAEVLGVGTSDVIVFSSDTDITPFDVGAYASSTTYLSGMAAKRCAEKVADQIRAVAAEMLEEDAKGIVLRDGKAAGSKGEVTLGQVGLRSLYEKDQHQIAAFASAYSDQSPPPFAAHAVEVEVDTGTGRVRIIRYITATDCGTAINPLLCEGQVEGALLNGISYAMAERFIYNEKGRLLNASFGTYGVYFTRDLPEIRTFLVPTYEPSGPFGAKSIAEVNINGPLPAISNAIFDAVGIRLRKPPYTPETVFMALRGRKEK